MERLYKKKLYCPNFVNTIEPQLSGVRKVRTITGYLKTPDKLLTIFLLTKCAR